MGNPSSKYGVKELSTIGFINLVTGEVREITDVKVEITNSNGEININVTRPPAVS